MVLLRGRVGVTLMLFGTLVAGCGNEDQAEPVDAPVSIETEDADPGIEAGGRAPIAPAIEQFVQTCAPADSTLSVDSAVDQCMSDLLAAIETVLASGIGEIEDADDALEQARSAAEELSADPDNRDAMVSGFRAAADLLRETQMTDRPGVDMTEIERAVDSLESDGELAEVEVEHAFRAFAEGLSSLAAGSEAAGV